MIRTNAFKRVIRFLCAMVLLASLLFFSFHMSFAMGKYVLYRYPIGDVSVGNFECNRFYYLLVEKLASSMVADQLDCPFLCVGEPKCYSFNMAAYPADSRGLYLCELLATDKYRATEKFHANATFHHYSPKVRFFLVSACLTTTTLMYFRWPFYTSCNMVSFCNNLICTNFTL